jgi:hypothetical protein
MEARNYILLSWIPLAVVFGGAGVAKAHVMIAIMRVAENDCAELCCLVWRHWIWGVIALIGLVENSSIGFGN